MSENNSKIFIKGKTIVRDLCLKHYPIDSNSVDNLVDSVDNDILKYNYPHVPNYYNLIRHNLNQAKLRKKHGDKIDVDNKTFNLTPNDYIYFKSDIFYNGGVSNSVGIENVNSYVAFLEPLFFNNWSKFKDASFYNWSFKMYGKSSNNNSLTVPFNDLPFDKDYYEDTYRGLFFPFKCDSTIIIFNETQKEYEKTGKLTKFKEVKIVDHSQVIFDGNLLYSVKLPKKYQFACFYDIVFSKES